MAKGESKCERSATEMKREDGELIGAGEYTEHTERVAIKQW